MFLSFRGPFQKPFFFLYGPVVVASENRYTLGLNPPYVFWSVPLRGILLMKQEYVEVRIKK